MVQRTETVEETPTETTTLIPAASEAVSADAEVSTQKLDAELAELMACLETGVAKGAQRGKTFLKWYLSFCAGLIVADLTWLAMVVHDLVTHTLMPMALAVGSSVLISSIIFLFVGLLWWIRKDWSTEQERDAAARILAIDDVRAVGPLMDALGLLRKSTTLRPSLWQALGRLLPRLTEEEAQALGDRRHYVLASCVQGWEMSANRSYFAGAGEETLLAILPVLGQLGKSSFQFRGTSIPVTAHLLPQLKKWAGGKGVGQSPAVQQAASACREAIEQKMALAQTGAQLLRASGPTPAESDTLLRPTQGVSQTDPAELLRPGDPE